MSLGPENPIIAINTALLVALVARLWPRVPTDLVVMLAAAATIGALFGTPVAAALVFTGVVAGFPGVVRCSTGCSCRSSRPVRGP